MATADQRQRGGSSQRLFVLGNKATLRPLQHQRVALALSRRAGLLRQILFWQRLTESIHRDRTLQDPVSQLRRRVERGIVAIPDSTVNVPVTLKIAAEFATDFLSSETLSVAPYGGSASASSQSVGGGTTVLSTSPAAIGSSFRSSDRHFGDARTRRAGLHRHFVDEHGPAGVIRDSLSKYDGAMVGTIRPHRSPGRRNRSERALYHGRNFRRIRPGCHRDTGITPATPLSVYLAGAISFPARVPASTYTYAVPLTGCPGSAPVSAVRIQVIPGLDPAVFVGTSAMLSDTEPDSTLADTAKILYPNWGDYDVHDGSPRRSRWPPGWNELPYQRCVFPVAGSMRIIRCWWRFGSIRRAAGAQEMLFLAAARIPHQCVMA